MLIAGAIMVRVGKKTEGPKLKELQVTRKKELDNMITALHGTLPGQEAE